MAKIFTLEEVQRHNNEASCWVIVKNKVYDLTDFLGDHPGGVEAILKYAGNDGTTEYIETHAEGTIEKPRATVKCLGEIAVASSPTKLVTSAERSHGLDPATVSVCVSIDDIERAARKTVSPRAWAYFHSAAASLGALRNNQEDWRKVSLRPRVLRDVRAMDMSCVILGQQSRLPFFIAPAARAGIVNQDGERCLVRGAVSRGIPYCVSNYTSVAHDDLVACYNEDTSRLGENRGSLFFQLYPAKEKAKSQSIIKMAGELGFKALVITVDAPVIGKREEDERLKMEMEIKSGAPVVTFRNFDEADSANPPIPRAHHSSSLSWDDLGWIREAWGANTGPLVLKGIQTVEDAALAMDAGFTAIYLSNHGGRQCDDAPSSIQTLMEIRIHRPDILDHVEIYLDGWVRRGADIVKALCLGASGVGIGRPLMYGLGAYGTAGVEKVIDILADEIDTTLRLIGVTNVRDLDTSYVNTTLLENQLLRATLPSARQTSRSSKL